MTKDHGYSLPLENSQRFSLPSNHHPVRPKGFNCERIILTKGCLSTDERQRYVENICSLFPNATIREQLDTPHNKVNLGLSNARLRHRAGKKTLVFGEHKSAVRLSEEQGNTCPNYWHFSLTGFCFYGCNYCYLAGTPGVWHSPTIKIFLNIEDIICKIDAVAENVRKPIAFYSGKLQDGLSLDPLTAYSTVLIPFFAEHPYARQVILTKSDNVDRLLPLEHKGHTILSWSLNPLDVCAQFEVNAPSIEGRMEAMKKCALSGYPVRAVIMPIIPVNGWRRIYSRFLRRLLQEVPISRLTMGGICSFSSARGLLESGVGKENAISRYFDRKKSLDGRLRYFPDLRTEMYSHLMEVVREMRPDLESALCLEELGICRAAGLEKGIGKCNCVL